MRQTTITLNYWTAPKTTRLSERSMFSPLLVAKRVTMPLSVLLEFANAVGSMREENIRKLLGAPTEKGDCIDEKTQFN